MKHKFITSLLLFLVVTIATAQSNIITEVEDVPEAITDNHGFYFPSSTNTEWRALNDEVYMVKFDFENEPNRFAYYNTKGLRVMYSQLVALSALPSKVKSKVKNAENEVNKITLYNPEMTIYKVYDANNVDKSSYVDANGEKVSADKLPAFMSVEHK